MLNFISISNSLILNTETLQEVLMLKKMLLFVLLPLLFITGCENYLIDSGNNSNSERSSVIVKSSSTEKMSGILGGGPIYQNRTTSITELKESGFTMVEVWTIHIESNGDMGFNAEFDLVKDGEYVGDDFYPYFEADIASLKQAPTSITQVNFGLSGWGSSTFNNVRDIIATQGTGPTSILYKNFQKLKEHFPDVDAINFDDETTYDTDSATQFAIMLADLGFKISICPYTNQSFWTTLIDNLNIQRPGSVDSVFLQCYAGGSGNNPGSWNFGDIPIYPGLDSNSGINSISTKLSNWKNQYGTQGGWIWLYDQVQGNSSNYAEAINNVFEIGEISDIFDHTNPAGTGTITARAQIHTDESKEMAFDNLYTSGTQNINWSKWLDNDGVPTSSDPSWIQIKLPDAVVVNALSITSANDDYGRDPEDFRLKASNNGWIWTTLESWTDQSFSSRFQKKIFSFSNSNSYKYYKLEITQNDGNVSMTQLCEIELLEYTF